MLDEVRKTSLSRTMWQVPTSERGGNRRYCEASDHSGLQVPLHDMVPRDRESGKLAASREEGKVSLWLMISCN